MLNGSYDSSGERNQSLACCVLCRMALVSQNVRAGSHVSGTFGQFTQQLRICSEKWPKTDHLPRNVRLQK